MGRRVIEFLGLGLLDLRFGSLAFSGLGFNTVVGLLIDVDMSNLNRTEYVQNVLCQFKQVHTDLNPRPYGPT